MAVDVTLNSRGARAVLNSPGVVEYLQSLGRNTQTAANAMMGPPASTDLVPYQLMDARTGRNRARVTIGTGGFTSRRDNAKNNTLLKALGSAG